MRGSNGIQRAEHGTIQFTEKCKKQQETGQTHFKRAELELACVGQRKVSLQCC